MKFLQTEIFLKHIDWTMAFSMTSTAVPYYMRNYMNLFGTFVFNRITVRQVGREVEE